MFILIYLMCGVGFTMYMFIKHEEELLVLPIPNVVLACVITVIIWPFFAIGEMLS